MHSVMKPDERTLLRRIYHGGGAYVRDIIQQSGMPPKRAYYILRKWAKLGFYSYGVCLDLGWLTERGKKLAEEMDEE